MKRSFFCAMLCATLAVIVFATPGAASEETYGKGVSAAVAVKLADLLAHPDQFVGKSLKVEGIVTDVCPMKGCWIRLAETAGGARTVQFKVPDGEMVFPATVRGKSAVVEGKLRRAELTREQAIEHQKHLAEEKGEPFDPASVTGPMTLYIIDGVGAVVR